MRGLAVGAYLLLAVAPSVSVADEQGDPGSSLGRLAWLAGCWGSEGPKGSAEECWLGPRAGLMLGVHRDVSASGEAVFEFLRIEARDEGIVYLASPKGRAATPFPLVRVEGASATFENPTHDFPQRIVYSRDATGHALTVRIEAMDGAGSSEWRWTRRPAAEGAW